MTDPRYAPIGLAAAGRLVPDDGETGGGEVVGADDAAADAAGPAPTWTCPRPPGQRRHPGRAPTPRPTRAGRRREGALADRPTDSTDLSRSLFYSGLLGLAISLAGLGLVGTRRRQW
ncbi:hypothetical protein COO58_27855 [Micromonospora sp. WMMA1996]|uniref:hypothetical protein n=1 Tax=Micromonospora sp. WMMA1996 TaxID=2039878 RepID=UPI000BF99C4E|nr:hypothetical protein [Micromonospora sp. WMMA1996]PGH41165.1 hypothetical protein COO58_27855 [Micromonospora sp. WMMA1996]